MQNYKIFYSIQVKSQNHSGLFNSKIIKNLTNLTILNISILYKEGVPLCESLWKLCEIAITQSYTEKHRVTQRKDKIKVINKSDGIEQPCKIIIHPAYCSLVNFS